MLGFLVAYTTLSTLAFSAEPPAECEARLAGRNPPVTLTIANDTSGVETLDSASLPRLVSAMRPLRYFGPIGEPWRVTIFRFVFEEGMDVVTPTTKIDLGLVIERGTKSEKVRFEHTYARLGPADALARSIADLINHFDLLISPDGLTREMHLLRAQLMILKAPEFDPLVDRRAIRGALRALLAAPESAGFFSGHRSRSSLRGKRFGAYLLAKQRLVEGWRSVPREDREHAARDLIDAYRPANASTPKPEMLRSTEVQDLALDVRRLLGRPLYVAISREAFVATSLWFETMANRGRANADGGAFLPTRFYGDLELAERQVFDTPPTAAAFATTLGLNPQAAWFQRLKSPEVATPEETGRLDTSWRGRLDEDNRPFGDPTSTAVGLPDPPSPSVGIPVNTQF